MDRINECLAEYKNWCEKVGIETISDVNRLVKEGKISWLINISEIWQEQKISEIAKTIKDNIKYKKTVLISGPSSSGKTSFATRLQLHLKVLGINAISISLDNYYLDKKKIPLNEKGEPDYEALEAIDYELFNQNLVDLTDGKEADIPVYDFKKPRTDEDVVKMKLNPDEVIIVEGIHGLNPKLSSSIPEDNKYKIYCSALTALSMDDGTRIKSRTTRLIRRLIRDYNFRGTGYAETLNMWPDVETGAQKNIFPFTDQADIIFNSSLLYELAVYKNPLNELFMETKEDLVNQHTIIYLTTLVNHFRSIEKIYTPPSSIIREFVGNSR